MPDRLRDFALEYLKELQIAHDIDPVKAVLRENAWMAKVSISGAEDVRASGNRGRNDNVVVEVIGDHTRNGYADLGYQ